MTFTRVFVLEQNFTQAWGALSLLLYFGAYFLLGGISSDLGHKDPKCSPVASSLYPVLKLLRGLVSQSRLSLPRSRFGVPTPSPSRLSNFHIKRKISGHLDEKVAGNGNHYKTPAEFSTNLRRRPFFFGLHLTLVTNL